LAIPRPGTVVARSATCTCVGARRSTLSSGVGDQPEAQDRWHGQHARYSELADSTSTSLVRARSPLTIRMRSCGTPSASASALTVAGFALPATARAATRTMRTAVPNRRIWRPPWSQVLWEVPERLRASIYRGSDAKEVLGVAREWLAGSQKLRVASRWPYRRRSMIVPVARAPPQHIEIRANCLSLRSSSWSAVVMRRAPVEPTG